MRLVVIGYGMAGARLVSEVHGRDPDAFLRRDREAGVHFLAQAGDENLHGARVILVVALPDALAKFRARENASGLLHQHLQHIELAR